MKKADKSTIVRSDPDNTQTVGQMRTTTCNFLPSGENDDNQGTFTNHHQNATHYDQMYTPTSFNLPSDTNYSDYSSF